MEYNVVIAKEHCNKNYLDGWDCPLFHAIKEQTDIDIKAVMGLGKIKLKDNRTIQYSPSIDLQTKKEDFDKVWSFETMERIQKGEIESFTVTINT